MVHRFFVFLFLSGLCLTVSFAIDKFIPIGNQEFLNNKTQIVNEMQEAKDIIISGDDKESQKAYDNLQTNHNNTLATNKNKGKSDNFLPYKRKKQYNDKTGLSAEVVKQGDNAYNEIIENKNNGEGDDVLQNNLNYIEKTLTNNTKHEENGTLLIQANQNQNDDDIVNNDINKLTYKLSQNASNSKLAKAIISKIANTINNTSFIEDDVDFAKLDKIYLVKEELKSPVNISNNDDRIRKTNLQFVENVAFASKNTIKIDDKIHNINPIQPNSINNKNLVAIADDDQPDQQKSTPTLVDRVSKLNQKTLNAVKKTKQAVGVVFKKNEHKEQDNANSIEELKTDLEIKPIKESNNLEQTSTREQKRNKRFATQISPPNISQKIYNLENKHLTPTVFDDDIIQNAFNQPNSEQGVENIKSIVRKFGFNIKDENGNTILMHAVAMGSYDLIHFLVNNGASPNLTNNEGFNVLHLVTSNNDYDSLYEIVSYSKIECDIADKEGNTPLVYAVSIGDLKMLKLLHLNGCVNLDIKTQNGLSLVDFAKQNPDPLVMDYIVSNSVNYNKQKTSDSINLNKKYNIKNKNGKL
jgi:ankyrin repeat protein